MKFRAKKRFGQNFLHDEGVINKIIDSVNPQTDQHLVEIGPGKGALTEPLVESECFLTVIELDQDLVTHLKNKYAACNNFALIHDDALKYDFSSLPVAEQKLRVVGNLPYNISTPLIFRLIGYAHIVEDMHLMLQKEVVDRLSSPPGYKDYGKLSVLSQYFCKIERLLDVPAECFFPAPKVVSAVVRLVPHKTFPIEVECFEVFREVVSTAFQMKRKTLKNNLKTLLSSDDIAALGIDPHRRAETLELAEFADLADQLFSMRSP